MRTSLLILIAVAMPVLASCGSNKAHDESTIPCVCGTDQAAIDGCANPICRDGHQNPDNPDCVCGPLEFTEE